MKKRILAAALAAACLTGCGAPEPQQLPQESDQEAVTVAYVPLDDRPVNADRVEYLAESLGYRLSMPEEDLYRTRLDGQGTNPNGTPYGDRAALYDWLWEQEEAGCDRYVLSLDQLLDSAETSPYDFIITHFTDLPSAEYDSRVLIPDDCPGLIVWQHHPFA